MLEMMNVYLWMRGLKMEGGPVTASRMLTGVQGLGPWWVPYWGVICDDLLGWFTGTTRVVYDRWWSEKT